MGVYPEDSEIHVSNLIKLWVGEGFLKLIIGKSLEEVAQEYLKDLIDRNLILSLEWKSTWKMKFCKIHDLLRDLCLREAQEENFLCMTNLYSFDNFPQGTNAKQRIVIHGRTWEQENEYSLPQIHDALPSAPLVRSLIREHPTISSSLNFRLLRVLKASRVEDIFFRRVNLRYFAVNSLDFVDNEIRTLVPLYSYRAPFDISRIYSSLYLLWNLQTLIFKNSNSTIEIWKMPQLRHVKFRKLFFLDPSANFSSYCLGMSDGQNDFVSENLQTLSNVVNFSCSEKMVKMIPNIKKLQISYAEIFRGSRYCLNNLACLHKLESLNLDFRPWTKPRRRDLMQNLTFPHSLKKLTLQGSNLIWKDISTKIGSLPLLQVLKLRWQSVRGCVWETVEGQFLSLMFLQIQNAWDLECWTTDNTHFPRLEHFVLDSLYDLEKIPSSIGEIPTLQSIELQKCSESAVFSAKEIVEEQEQLGNESLQVLVILWGEKPL